MYEYRYTVNDESEFATAKKIRAMRDCKREPSISAQMLAEDIARTLYALGGVAGKLFKLTVWREDGECLGDYSIFVDISVEFRANKLPVELKKDNVI